MFLIKKVQFDSSESEYGNARYEQVIGVIDGDESYALKWIEEHRNELGRKYRGWDEVEYPYFEKEHVNRLE